MLASPRSMVFMAMHRPVDTHKFAYTAYCIYLALLRTHSSDDGFVPIRPMLNILATLYGSADYEQAKGYIAPALEKTAGSPSLSTPYNVTLEVGAMGKEKIDLDKLKEVTGIKITIRKTRKAKTTVTVSNQHPAVVAG